MLTPPRSARRRPVALASLALLCALAACGDGDDPVGPVAALPVSAAQLDALAEKLEPMSRQPVFDAFLMMRFKRGLPFDGEVFFPLGSVWATSPAASSVAAAPARVSPQLVPRLPAIPDTLRGRTLVRDSMSFVWTIDRLPDGTPRPGAPPDGLRFVLSQDFAPGPASTRRVGAMDVTQQGTGRSARFTTEVRNTDGVHVLHFAAPLSGYQGSGWVSHGATRVDQAASVTSRGHHRVRWTSATIPLQAERTDALDGNALLNVYVLPFEGAQLRLVSAMSFAADETERRTYTVYLGEAPFARRADSMMLEGTWRHVGENRPLSDGELAQVQAFLRVLAAIPDAEAAWDEAMSDLIGLQFPLPPF